MQNQTATAVTAALIASVLFLMVLGTGLGVVFFFVATIPLFFVGLSGKLTACLQACSLASIPIAIVTASPSITFVFLAFLAAPTWMICHFLTKHFDLKIGEQLPILRLWYPAGLVTMHLAIYACAVLAVITTIFATGETNLPQYLDASIKTQITTMKQEYNIEFESLPSNFSFMLCGFMAWLWAALLWFQAWTANLALIHKKMAARPSLAITPFPMPAWLLTLMGICALASLIGGESMRFLGKASLIILLLPYFFQGLAFIHVSTHKWAGRSVFLFFIYLSVAIFFWPAFALAGIGLWQHIKMLNKNLSNGGKSSTS